MIVRQIFKGIKRDSDGELFIPSAPKSGLVMASFALRITWFFLFWFCRLH
jgi:hypothetical protein